MEEEIPWESGSEIDSSWEEVLNPVYDWELGMEVALVTRNTLSGQLIPPWAVFERGFIDHVSDTDEDRFYPYFVYLRDNWDGEPAPILVLMDAGFSWSDTGGLNARRWFRRMPVPAM